MVDLSSFLLSEPLGEEGGKEDEVGQRHPTLYCGASCSVVVSTLTRQVRDLGSTPSRAQCVAGQGDS